MKTSTRLFACALLAFAVLMFVSAAGTARPRDARECHLLLDDSVGALNKLGAEGWELVSAVSEQPNQVRIILKRRKA